MHLDDNGLPTQADGDRNDQLQRVGMCAVAYALGGYSPIYAKDMWVALKRGGRLHPKPGTLVRYQGADPRNCSGDQIISALAAVVAWPFWREATAISWGILRRGGFAQNIHDGLDGKPGKWKVPDFILIRALPLMCRVHWLLWPLACLADVLLVVAGLMAGAPVWRDGKGFSARSPDDVDDNVQLLTFAVCRLVNPTPLSVLGNWLYGKLRPQNYGCGINAFHPVQGALEWYHRKESGGNPEIAESWRPITARLYGRRLWNARKR
jgi:hypothetical protein